MPTFLFYLDLWPTMQKRWWRSTNAQQYKFFYFLTELSCLLYLILCPEYISIITCRDIYLNSNISSLSHSGLIFWYEPLPYKHQNTIAWTWQGNRPKEEYWVEEVYVWKSVSRRVKESAEQFLSLMNKITSFVL